MEIIFVPLEMQVGILSDLLLANIVDLNLSRLKFFFLSENKFMQHQIRFLTGLCGR